MNLDLFDPPEETEAPKPPSALRSLKAKKTNWLATTFLTAAAHDDPELIAQCPPGERNSAIVRGILLILYVIFLAIDFAIIGHDLLNSSFDPAIVLGAMFMAAFLGLVDHYVMLRTAIFPDGMKGLRHGGFDVDVPIGAGLSSKLCKALRVMLSVALGCVVAVFMGLALNRAAVNKRIAAMHLAANSVLVQKATADFNARRLRASSPYESAAAAQKFLSDENARLLKQLNGRSAGKIADRLASNEARLAPAKTVLDEARRSLDTIDARRSDEIEQAIARDPNFVPKNDSVIAQLKALFAEIHDDPWSALPIAIFAAVIVGIDAVILTLKAIAMPSTYCMADCRRHLSEMVRQARLAVAETEDAEPSEVVPPEPDGPSPSPLPARPFGLNGSVPPRRGRGRPRKNNSVQLNGGGDHA